MTYLTNKIVRHDHPRLLFSPPFGFRNAPCLKFIVPKPEWVAKFVAVGGSAVQVY